MLIQILSKYLKPHSTSLNYIFYRFFFKIINTNLARGVSHTSYDSDSWQTTCVIFQLKGLIIWSWFSTFQRLSILRNAFIVFPIFILIDKISSIC